MFIKNILTIWKKEVRSYFYTPLVAFFVGIFTLTLYFLFYGFLIKYQSYTQSRAVGFGSNITIDQLAEAVYGNMHFIMLWLLPFFTFRLFTEEARQNTLVLLLTSPIRPWELVLAKFKAALTVLLIMLAVTLIFPFFLYIYSADGGGGPDMGVVASTYVGLFLVGACYMAMGLFWSSITESVLIALVLTFVSNFFAAFLLCILRPEGGGAFDSVLEFLCFNTHVATFLKGTIDLKSVVYFLSLSGFFLFLTNRSLESRSWRS